MVAAFDGGAGHLGCRGAAAGRDDRAIGLVRRLARCFTDGRAPALVEHTVETMVVQRIFGIALGYEDLIDHDELRHDPVLATLAGKLEAQAQGLRAARRQEHAEPARARAVRACALPQDRPRSARRSSDLFVDLFLEAHTRRPSEIILDLDATDDPLHGHQEGRFFHGYYDCYCYLPLYVFCGRHLLAAKLRRSNIDASAGASERWSASSARSARAGRGWRSCCAPTPALPARS